MPIDKEGNRISTLIEPSNNPRHEISNDDQVAYAHAKALDSNRSIKHNGRIWIRDL
jgi:hypothetical protein